MADQNNTTNHTGGYNANGYNTPGNNTSASDGIQYYTTETGYYTPGDADEPFMQIIKEGNFNGGKVPQRNMSQNPSVPNEKRPHTHIPQYEPVVRGTYEEFVDHLQDSAHENLGDFSCDSHEHKERSIPSRLWSGVKGAVLFLSASAAAWGGTKLGIYTEREEIPPPDPVRIVTTIPQSPSIKKVRFDQYGSYVVTVSPSDPDDPGTGMGDRDANGRLTDESGSPADLKGTVLEGMGRYVYFETTPQWIGYGTWCNTVVKIVIDTEEMTAKITFERGEFAGSHTDTMDPDSTYYKFLKEYLAKQPIAECTCKVNRKFYLFDRSNYDGYIDESEYEEWMTDSWPTCWSMSRDRSHFLLNFTDFQWTTEPYIIDADYYSEDNLEACDRSMVGIPEGSRGDMPVMRMMAVDPIGGKGITSYSVVFAVSPEDAYASPGYPYLSYTYDHLLEVKEYTGGAPAASDPAVPAATATPTPTPAPILIEYGRPQVTANGGGTVTPGDDGSVAITPDAGKKIGQILVNDDPLPVPPDGRLTGFTPEDKVEVRFIDENEPAPTLPPAQTVDNGSGSNGNNGGGAGGNGGNSGNGGSGSSGDGNGGNGGGSYTGDGNGGSGNGGNGNSGGGNGDGSSSGSSGSTGDNGGSSGNGGSGNGGSGTGSQPTPPPGPKANPNISLTRAQLLNLLWAYKGYPTASYTSNPFTDVSESDYYYQAVLWALEAELIEGTPGSTLEPNRVCAFHELAPIMQRYYRMF